VSDKDPDNYPGHASGADAHHERVSEYDSTIDYGSAVDHDSAVERDSAVDHDSAENQDSVVDHGSAVDHDLVIDSDRSDQGGDDSTQERGFDAGHGATALDSTAQDSTAQDSTAHDATGHDAGPVAAGEPSERTSTYIVNESVTVTGGDREYETRLNVQQTRELAAEAEGVIGAAVAADIEATGADHIAPSRYVPPALVDPDAAARAVAAAAAVRAAERADAAAKLAGLSSASAPVDQAIGYTPPARLTAAAGSEPVPSPARSADVVQFTAPSKVIGRSNYVITPDTETGAEVDPSAPAVVPARPTPTEPVQATPDPADAVFTRPEQRIVYVEAPAAPQKKGNRGVGSLLAVVSSLAFAVLFAAVIFLLFWATTGRAVTNFIGEESFFVPVVMYAIGFVLLVLVLNRAAWWAYIVGSIFVGLFVYFGTAGVLLLLGGVIEATPAQASADFARALANPLVIAAGIIAREASLWTGAAIASRGRRVKAKNAKAMDQYNHEMEERKAGNGRASAGPSA
jgi:hypothetical protein